MECRDPPLRRGWSDWILPVREMPDRLAAYWAAESRIRIPDSTAPAVEAAPGAEDEHILQQILSFLRVNTGRDFSYYQAPNRLTASLSAHAGDGERWTCPPIFITCVIIPAETGALLQDLLISVTNFFRDVESFQALEAALPRLFKDKKQVDHIRVWVAGVRNRRGGPIASPFYCRNMRPAFRHLPIFRYLPPTLMSRPYARRARALTPETIAADVSEERLRQFFLHDPRILSGQGAASNHGSLRRAQISCPTLPSRGWTWCPVGTCSFTSIARAPGESV